MCVLALKHAGCADMCVLAMKCMQFCGLCVCMCVGTRSESEVGVSSSPEDKAITLSPFSPTLVGA